MWAQDKINWDEEERRLRSRINKINSDNQNYLMKQVQAKYTQQARMNPHEFALNRPLLREINNKLKN